MSKQEQVKNKIYELLNIKEDIIVLTDKDYVGFIGKIIEAPPYVEFIFRKFIEFGKKIKKIERVIEEGEYKMKITEKVEITLADVLRAIKKPYTRYKNINKNNNELLIVCEDYRCIWNLKENYNNQPQEVYDFLWEVLVK